MLLLVFQKVAIVNLQEPAPGEAVLKDKASASVDLGALRQGLSRLSESLSDLCGVSVGPQNRATTENLHLASLLPLSIYDSLCPTLQFSGLLVSWQQNNSV